MNKKQVLLFLTVLISMKINAQAIKFKDSNLKLALIDLGYDFNKDNEIGVSEIDTVKILKIQKRNINILDDLIHFKNLKILNVTKNNVKNLNVFFNNPIIEEIYVGDNKLGEKLLLKNITNLKGLFAFKNGIEYIELQNTNKIEQLYLQENLFKEIQFKNLSKLRTLQLNDNLNLKSIDVSNNVELKQLYLTGTSITKLNILSNPILKTLYIEKNVNLIKDKSQDDLKAMPKINTTN